MGYIHQAGSPDHQHGWKDTRGPTSSQEDAGGATSKLHFQATCEVDSDIMYVGLGI